MKDNANFSVFTLFENKALVYKNMAVVFADKVYVTLNSGKLTVQANICRGASIFTAIALPKIGKR